MTKICLNMQIVFCVLYESDFCFLHKSFVFPLLPYSVTLRVKYRENWVHDLLRSGSFKTNQKTLENSENNYQNVIQCQGANTTMCKKRGPNMNICMVQWTFEL